jgi:glycosyltransferase involved in cell wall biosynthesis
VRALHLISTAQRRGAEQVAWNLIHALGPLGVPSTLVAWAPTNSAEPFPLLTLGQRRIDLRALARLARLARTHDVVVAHGGTTLWPCVLAATATRRPLVYRNVGDPSHWGSTTARRLRVGAGLRMAAAVVALYPEAGEWMASAYRVPRERFTWIPNAVDGGHFSPASDRERLDARHSIGVPAEGPVLAFVGALSAEKRPDVAVEVARRIPGVHLVVAGDGPMRAEVERAAADLDRVSVLGPVADTRPIFAAADAVLIPSDTEGVPGVLLESLLCGTPVVATPVGGIPELVTARRGRVSPNQAGAFAQATAELLATGQRVPESESAELARHHSIDVVADQWASVIRGVARS